MANENSQRRFAVMGNNTYRIANKIMSNQRICRLLKYQSRNPFEVNEKQPDVRGEDLINKQILIVPKVYDEDLWKTSYIVAVFDNFIVNPMNPEFKISTIRFNVACPYDEWLLNDNSLRPYLIMQELDNMFNESKLAGIGNLQFLRADALTLSPQIGGYSLRYSINEFN